MTLRSSISSLRQQSLCSFYRRIVSLEEAGPVVTFTFDDFPRSALTVGGDIVERCGGRATYYVSMGLMGTTNRLGVHFDEEDLCSLVERGHELANHTFSHISARRTSFETFSKNVERCENVLRQIVGGRSHHNFAYPYGEVTLAMKRKMGTRVTSCRGTCSGVNGPEVDLNLLKANRLYGSIETLEAAKRLILENERRKGWLIFYTHDVDIEPSPFGCTPQLLEEVASFAAKHSQRLATVDDVTAALSGPGMIEERMSAAVNRT
jgi:peptidoglycan/xylan/chitin deacetylase (PgdA/CDA1 family)